MNKIAVNTSHRRAMEYVRDYNDKLTLVNGVQPSAFTYSFGCQQNAVDGETLEGILLEMGYTVSLHPETADVVLYNTCAVRENAENTVFGTVGKLKNIKQLNPDMIIGICGCMTQQKHIAEQIRKSYPFVDLLFGAGAMDTLPELIATKLKTGTRVFNVGGPTTEIIENLPVHRDSKVKAFVPIMSGCNNFCSYCVVPYVRGRERSRSTKNIIAEVTKLVSAGYKEITLLGQNVNSYGKGLDIAVNFSSLLEQVANIPGKFRIRFMTSHPKDCDQRLIDTVAKYDKISKHIHLPIQSGSNRMLEPMNRGYTVESYLGIIEYAKTNIPEISFTSDIIIGFPGENDDDFEATYRLVNKVGYSALYTFAYSPRQGTKACTMENNLTQAEKTKRFDCLLALQREKSNEFNQKYLKKTVEVLAEDKHKSKDGFIVGRTDNNLLVIFKGDLEDIGNFVNVQITNYMDWAIEGNKV